ncbi:exodeoxyribonuclease VII small subunit [Allofustis seminis]|uniref:exodeoxyribonuclease VII small subunit n=1 Tax=Allofustis seminis TaxID=166939 RepID=UPI00036E961B|nr:exodeoxyribonuclease VII small subunit [Allofustis seminis]
MAEKMFEEKLKDLEMIVQQLEKGEVPLAEALNLFEEGMAISKDLKTQLETAEKRLIKIVDENGNETDFEQSHESLDKE